MPSFPLAFPLAPPPPRAGLPDADPATMTQGITRGVCRHLANADHVVLTEFKLPNRRRADVAALGPDGRLLLVEVKSSLNDYRSDDKWPEYLPYCDAFAFAVAETFPRDILPPNCGLLIADPWGAEIVRLMTLPPLAPARRRALTLRFARTAGERLHRLVDPPL